MQREKTNSQDNKIFRRTAQKTKSVNIYRTNARGGLYF